MFQRAKDGRVLLLAIGLLLAGVSNADAAEPVATEVEPAVQQTSDGCDAQRAGNYHEGIALRVRPSNEPGDIGYYVGGGAPFRGQPRTASEGTWGWDYSGPLCFRHIDLGWWHGARYQGGSGQYRPDGPKLGNR